MQTFSQLHKSNTKIFNPISVSVAVFPPCYLTWGQTVVEVMKIMVTSKRYHAGTAAFSAPNPAAGHRWPMPPPETPRHSRASLGQSLVGSLLLSPGSWCTQGSVCAVQSLSPQSCVSSGSSMVGLMEISFKRAYAIPVCRTQSSCPCSSPLLTRASSGDTQTQFGLSLWALWVQVHTRYV